jgi:phosphoadenosine phosphosulfate reductase
MTEAELEELNQRFEAAPPDEILAWAVERFWPEIVVSSSFQTEGLPLLHLVSQIKPDLPVIFLDTGYHFPETLAFRDRLVAEWGLNLRVVAAAMSRSDFIRQYGDDLYRSNPDLCCYLNKVEPMARSIAGLSAWISGVRRDQTQARADLEILEETLPGTLRIHPMATWTLRDVRQYAVEHHLPEHPLLAVGYLSVGCAPCTRPVRPGEEARAGRWSKQNKTECGLHTLLRRAATSGA